MLVSSIAMIKSELDWHGWKMLRSQVLLGIVGMTLAPAGIAAAEENVVETAPNFPRLLSLGTSYNAGFNRGTYDRFQDFADLRAFVSFPLENGHSIVSRTIVPYYTDKPDVMDPSRSTVGLGDTLTAFFLTPPPSDDLVFSFGPAIGLPTATDDTLGYGKWLAGFSGLALATFDKKLAVGGFFSNFWSVAGDSSRSDVNTMLLEPILRYQLKDGWFAYSTPLITANWEASGKERWTIPIGGGLGKDFRIGDQVFQAQASIYKNILSPTNGSEWSFQAKFTLLFPDRIPRVNAAKRQ